MLKLTGVKLELISDIEVYLFIEQGLTGGVSYICKRFSDTSNNYIKNYDPTKESKFIMYLDAKKLYGWAMIHYLPYGEFRWLKNIDNFDVNFLEKNSPIGYIIEVDLDYPDELHELYNHYPLAPEKLAVPYDMLSNYC